MKIAILFKGSITSASMRQLSLALIDVYSREPDQVYLFIDSQGGMVACALAMAEWIQTLPLPLTTVNAGNVDSAAIPLFASGYRRLCLKISRFHTHPVGKTLESIQHEDDLRRALFEVRDETKRICSFLERRSGTSAHIWKRMMKNHTRILSHRAERLGLAVIVDKLPIIDFMSVCCAETEFVSNIKLREGEGDSSSVK